MEEGGDAGEEREPRKILERKDLSLTPFRSPIYRFCFFFYLFKKSFDFFWTLFNKSTKDHDFPRGF